MRRKKQPKSFFVRVTKCTKKYVSYQNLIGRVFEVVKDPINSYYYNFYPESMSKHYGLLRCDCEIVDPKEEAVLNELYKEFKRTLPRKVPGHLTAKKLNSIIRAVGGI